MANEVEIVVKGTNRAKGAFKDVENDASKMEGTLKRVGKGMDDLNKKVIKTPKIASGDKNELFREGQKAGEVFTFGMFKTLQTLPPQAYAGLIAGAAAAAPVISGVLSAAVLTAVGGSVMAGGIFLAAKDPRVMAAWGEVGRQAGTGLTKASGVFVKPLMEAADDFGRAFGGKILPSLAKDFQLTAPLVHDVTDGLIGLATKAMPGIDAGVRGALPVIRQFAAELPAIGASFTSMMQDFERSSGGAVEGMKLLGGAIRGTFETTGFLISNANYELATFAALLHGDLSSALTNAAAAGEQFDTKFLQQMLQNMGPVGQTTGLMVDLLGQIGEKAGVSGNAGTAMGQALGGALAHAAEEANKTAPSFDVLMQKIGQTAATADTVFGAAAAKMFNSFMTLDQATLGFAEAQTAVGESIKDNGRQLDIHTGKGQANRESILAAVGANMQLFQANIASGMGATQATAAYESNTAALESQLRKAGFTQGAIDGLIGKYRGVPADVNTNINTYGLEAAINSLDDAIRLANGLDGRKVTFTIQEVHRTTYTSDTAPSNYFKGLATGGIQGAAGGGARSNWTMVGEHGRELVKLAPGSQVVPNGKTESMMAGGGGGGPVQLTLAAGAGFGSDFERVLLGFVLKAIQLDNSGIRSAIRDVAAAA